MKPKEALVYFTGTDIFKKHYNFQQQLLEENTGKQ